MKISQKAAEYWLLSEITSHAATKNPLPYKSLCTEGDDHSFHRGSTPLVPNFQCRPVYGQLYRQNRFRTSSFMTITESPGRIGAAQSWSSITFLRKPLHYQMGFLSVTFAVIYSSLLRFVFLLRLLFRLSIFLDYTTHLVVVKSCIG